MPYWEKTDKNIDPSRTQILHDLDGQCEAGLKGPSNTTDKRFPSLLRAQKPLEKDNYRRHKAAVCDMLVTVDVCSVWFVFFDFFFRCGY